MAGGSGTGTARPRLVNRKKRRWCHLTIGGATRRSRRTFFLQVPLCLTGIFLLEPRQRNALKRALTLLTISRNGAISRLWAVRQPINRDGKPHRPRRSRSAPRCQILSKAAPRIPFKVPGFGSWMIVTTFGSVAPSRRYIVSDAEDLICAAGSLISGPGRLK